jgi:hypothetical protein
LLTILRWWKNPSYPDKNKNKLISRSLGKIAFVSRSAFKQPSEGTFWLSSVSSELHAGCLKGCFFADPLEEIFYENLISLNETNCTVSPTFQGKFLIIDPYSLLTPEGYIIPWFLSLTFRERLKSPTVLAMIVNLGGDWWEKLP